MEKYAPPASWQTEYLQNGFAYNNIQCINADVNAQIKVPLPGSVIVSAVNNNNLLIFQELILSGSLDLVNTVISLVDAGQSPPTNSLHTFTISDLLDLGHMRSGDCIAHLLVYDDINKNYGLTYNAQLNAIPAHKLQLIVTLPSPELDTATTATIQSEGLSVFPKYVAGSTQTINF